jgi:hypothetical protein
VLAEAERSPALAEPEPLPWTCGARFGHRNTRGDMCGASVGPDTREGCGYHVPGSRMGVVGAQAQRSQRAAVVAKSVVVDLRSRRGVERTLATTARAVADGIISDKRGNVIARCAAEAIRMLDLRLAEREEALAAIEGVS